MDAQHGAGSNTRSFLYVDDVADAFDVVLHRGRVGETYNVGSPGEERSVIQVARDICKACGIADPESAIQHVSDRRFNDRRYLISDAKLRQLGWFPRTPWKEGLSSTVRWYRSIDPEAYWGSDRIEEALRAHPTPSSSSVQSEDEPPA